VVAINAGTGLGGAFSDTNIKDEIQMINLNVISLVHLSKFVVKEMKKQGGGKILYTSSIASVMPNPFQAVYAATKAFTSSFAEALRNEVKEFGISITLLMPGATNTNFFHRAHLDDTKVGAETKFENDPQDVARQGYEALMAGTESVFAASLKTKIQGWAAKILPENLKAQMSRKISEPGSAHH
jgi:short-subunit dehydrogenase